MATEEEREAFLNQLQAIQDEGKQKLFEIIISEVYACAQSYLDPEPLQVEVVSCGGDAVFSTLLDLSLKGLCPPPSEDVKDGDWLIVVASRHEPEFVEDVINLYNISSLRFGLSFWLVGTMDSVDQEHLRKLPRKKKGFWSSVSEILGVDPIIDNPDI